MLYNGPETDCPYDQMELKLSDLFEIPSPGYEWTTYVININEGHNQELMAACELLNNYSGFVRIIKREAVQ